jgi:hypothetical protein
MKQKSTLAAIFMLVVILFGIVPASQPVAALTTCDWAQFIADVNYPDGTDVTAGSGFDKIWRLKNIGSCTWTGYTLVYVDGTSMGAPASTPVPGSVAPGSTVDLTVHLTAPASAGTYRANFQLKNASSVQFGIGSSANRSFWVEIKVGGGGSAGIAYDFVGFANDPGTVWSSSVVNPLTFNGADPNTQGVAKKLVAPITLESGGTDPAPGLLVAPDSNNNGYIQGKYPAFTVQSGDRFQSIINCEYLATSCWVQFRLDYQIGSGPVQNLWKFNEKYEGLYARANIDLSSLAGQSVNFILCVNAAGSATGDRAVWGGPRIVRAGAVTPTPIAPPTAGPSPTPSITPTAGPTSTPASLTDRVTFISDITYLDGAVVPPGSAFTKTWRIKNTGTSTWTTSYKLVFVSGDMSAADVPLVSTVGPNTSINVSVNLTAPSAIGHYRGYWMLKNAGGTAFGIGSAANKSWWVDIVVSSGATAVPSAGGTVVFDFPALASSARWVSSTASGDLTFPGAAGATDGFALKNTSIKMEDALTYNSSASLSIVPPNAKDAYIQGVYPAYTPLSGDRFKATVGCEYGYPTCSVIFRLDYQRVSDSVIVPGFWTYTKATNGSVVLVDVDLTPLAGTTVKFFLTVVANVTPPDPSPAANNFRAVWIYPRIVR